MQLSDSQADDLARRYLETLAAGEFDRCMALFHPEAVVKFPASIPGAQALTTLEFGAMLRNMPNLFDIRPKYEFRAQTSERGRTCLEFTGTGTLKNGAEFNMEYCIVFIAAHGLIVEMREYLDTGALQALARKP